MSFYHNDPRPDETIPKAHHELTSVEIGVIVATVATFFVLVITVFVYRNRKAKKALARQQADTELGQFNSEDKDDPSRPGTLPSTRDSDLPEPPSPTEPKPTRQSESKPRSQFFYTPRMFLKSDREPSPTAAIVSSADLPFQAMPLSSPRSTRPGKARQARRKVFGNMAMVQGP